MKLVLDAINLLHRAAVMLAVASESSKSKECIFCDLDPAMHMDCPWMKWCKDFELLEQRERQEREELQAV